MDLFRYLSGFSEWLQRATVLAPGGAAALGQTYSTSGADTGIEHFDPNGTGYVRGGGISVNLGSAAAVIFAMPAQAQSLREQVIGAWELVSCPNDPAAVIICGTNPNDIQILAVNGHYAGTTAARGRPKTSVFGAGRDEQTITKRWLRGYLLPLEPGQSMRLTKQSRTISTVLFSQMLKE
jgi:hypothetical protein